MMKRKKTYFALWLMVLLTTVHKVKAVNDCESTWECRTDVNGSCPDAFSSEQDCIAPDDSYVIQQVAVSADFSGMEIKFRKGVTDSTCVVGSYSWSGIFVSIGYDINGLDVCFSGGTTGRVNRLWFRSTGGGNYPVGDMGGCASPSY